jgi:tetratricopeptide (TPR) repeat protein
MAAYQKAIELDPKFAHPWNGLGNVYSDLSRPEEAMAAYQKAIELDPKFAYPWNGLGILHTLFHCYDEALVAFQKAVELAPKDGNFNASLAGILRRLGRMDEHARQVEVARPLMEKESDYNRACLESICGHVDEALRLLKMALEKKQTSLAWARRDPDFDFIREDPRFKELVGE